MIVHIIYTYIGFPLTFTPNLIQAGLFFCNQVWTFKQGDTLNNNYPFTNFTIATFLLTYLRHIYTNDTQITTQICKKKYRETCWWCWNFIITYVLIYTRAWFIRRYSCAQVTTMRWFLKILPTNFMCLINLW